MFRYTNILTGNNICTNSEITGENWMRSDEIEKFRKQSKEVKTTVDKEEVKEEKEESERIEIPTDLQSLTKSDLSELLFSLGVNHDSKMTKNELIELVEKNR